MTPREIERWLNPDWRTRMLAWWEGYDLSSLQRQARAARAARAATAARTALPDIRSHGEPPVAGPSSILVPDTSVVAETSRRLTFVEEEEAIARACETLEMGRDGRPVWSAERVTGAQLLWGDGFVAPGDGAWMVDNLRPFGLKRSDSVLDLAAGLGGGTRAIVNAFESGVTGLEPSPVLARLAMRRSQAAGMGKSAPILHYDPEQFSPGDRYDLVVGDRILHRVRDKDVFLDTLRRCLKPRAGMMMMDYVADEVPSSPAQWAEWRRAEPVEPVPWTLERLSGALAGRALDVAEPEDLTLLHRAQVLDRVRRLAALLDGAAPDGHLLGGLARELSLWWSRLRVLGRGLRFVRLVARRPA